MLSWSGAELGAVSLIFSFLSPAPTGQERCSYEADRNWLHVKDAALFLPSLVLGQLQAFQLWCSEECWVDLCFLESAV